ncbi:unnamed protein product [Brassica rapa subsp. trilocularis]
MLLKYIRHEFIKIINLVMIGCYLYFEDMKIKNLTW